jgi:hypothetical protein
MDDAGAVEEHVNATDLAKHGADSLVVEHVEHPCLDAGPLQLGEFRLVDVRGNDAPALAREQLHRGPADTLRRGRDDRDLAGQSSRHISSPVFLHLTRIP